MLEHPSVVARAALPHVVAPFATESVLVDDQRGGQRAAEVGIVRLLDAEPDLARHLERREAERASRVLVVPTHAVARGAWDPWSLAAGYECPTLLGVLVLSGVLTREIRLGDRCSIELLGPGDVLRVWECQLDANSLVCGVASWSALERTKLAVLDRRFHVESAPWPEVTAELMGRLAARGRSLALRLAIAQLRRLDERLLLVLWHLAERWGRVAAGGMLLSLALSHRVLSQLVCAQRPPVTTALARLAERGLVRRLPNGRWFLVGAPPVTPMTG